MLNEIITTNYFDIKTGQDKTQYWLGSIEEEYFNYQDLVTPTGRLDIIPVMKYFEKLNGNWQWPTVTFTPLTENNPLAHDSREYHRGYDTDKNPFIVRGNDLGELIAVVSGGVDQNIRFQSYGRNGAKLTPTVNKWLTDTFSNQLKTNYTRGYVIFLQEQAKERAAYCLANLIESVKVEADIFLSKLKKLT